MGRIQDAGDDFVIQSSRLPKVCVFLELDLVARVLKHRGALTLFWPTG